MMDRKLERILEEVYRKGQEHDVGDRAHSERMLNITPETGQFLSILIQSTNARRILEIGTSNGYSTIWLAHGASKIGGIVTSLEISKHKHEMAIANVERSGLENYVRLTLEDARSFVRKARSESFDFIFLDAERPQYDQYWRDLDRILKLNGLLVADNAISPKPEEMKGLIDFIISTRRYESQTLELGKGEFIALKEIDSV